jgi:hypothetical protein
MGVEAAHALYAIWENAQPATDEDRHMLRSWPDFSEVQEKRCDYEADAPVRR